jgi:hypothetical protein
MANNKIDRIVGADIDVPVPTYVYNLLANSKYYLFNTSHINGTNISTVVHRVFSVQHTIACTIYFYRLENPPPPPGAGGGHISQCTFGGKNIKIGKRKKGENVKE